MNVQLLRVTLCCAVLSLLAFSRADGTFIPLGDYSMGGTYSGIMPCADCGGVWMELTLTDFGPDAGQGKGPCVMTERFTGGARGGAVITVRGSWSAVAWVQGQGFTATLELLPTKRDGDNAAPLYFYCDHGRYLRLLAERSTDFAFAAARPGFPLLQRVIPRPRFGPLTEGDSRAPIFAKVGDEFTIALPAPNADSTLTFWTIAQSSAKNVDVVGPWGSGNGDEYSSGFNARATAPGTITVTFRSTDKPARTVTFTFEVTP